MSSVFEERDFKSLVSFLKDRFNVDAVVKDGKLLCNRKLVYYEVTEVSNFTSNKVNVYNAPTSSITILYVNSPLVICNKTAILRDYSVIGKGYRTKSYFKSAIDQAILKFKGNGHTCGTYSFRYFPVSGRNGYVGRCAVSCKKEGYMRTLATIIDILLPNRCTFTVDYEKEKLNIYCLIGI